MQTIFSEPIPAHWPGDAARLINDLRRAYAALERDGGGNVVVNLPDATDEIENECRSLRLTRVESAMWKTLRSRVGARFDNETLYYAVYGGTGCDVQPKIVDVYICKIRAKLIKWEAPWRIMTVHGRGWFLLTKADYDARMEERRLNNSPANLLAGIDATDSIPAYMLDRALRGLGLKANDIAPKFGITRHVMQRMVRMTIDATPDVLRGVAKMVRDAKAKSVHANKPIRANKPLRIAA